MRLYWGVNSLTMRGKICSIADAQGKVNGRITQKHFSIDCPRRQDTARKMNAKKFQSGG